MKIVKKLLYQCEICDEKYDTEKEALACEKKPVTEDIGVKVGDTVMCTGGQGAGNNCTVTRISVISKYWGHHMWKRYWHTIALHVDFKLGSRMLTFDDYRVLI